MPGAEREQWIDGRAVLLVGCRRQVEVQPFFPTFGSSDWTNSSLGMRSSSGDRTNEYVAVISKG